MAMLAGDVDHVIGVDTHRDTHSAAIVAVTGVVVAHRGEPATPFGYKRLLRFVLLRDRDEPGGHIDRIDVRAE